MAESEIRDAKSLGQELGLGDRHYVVASNELEREGFADNPANRCALCKTELMSVAEPIATRLGATVMLGTNTDDLGDFRPGIAAAQEHGAISPMVEAGLSKAEVRTHSRALGLRTWDKPQLACLSSRFPQGTRITAERLRRVDRFEDGLRELGFRQVRVRFHDDIARVELEEAEIARGVELRSKLVSLGQNLGFKFVTIDLQGFRSGSTSAVALVPLRGRPT